MVAAFVIGKRPISEGMRILGAHIDSPRLDLKQNPLYEDTDMALLDTHYYGGVKKYQWVTLPLALHGVIAKKDGSVINVCVGEKEDDPVFGVSDLLIHLSSEQLDKKASKVIEGEDLNVLVGSIPLESEDEKECVKANVLRILCEQYDIEEEDFLSAEIEAYLRKLVQEIADDKEFTVHLFEAGEGDHIHCFVSAPPKMSVTDLVKYLKGITGRKLFEKYPEIRQKLWKGQLWNHSYYVETIGSVSEENIRRYIEHQSKSY